MYIFTFVKMFTCINILTDVNVLKFKMSYINAYFICSDNLFQIAAVTVLSQQMGAQLFFYFFIN